MHTDGYDTQLLKLQMARNISEVIGAVLPILVGKGYRYRNTQAFEKTKAEVAAFYQTDPHLLLNPQKHDAYTTRQLMLNAALMGFSFEDYTALLAVALRKNEVSDYGMPQNQSLQEAYEATLEFVNQTLVHQETPSGRVQENYTIDNWLIDLQHENNARFKTVDAFHEAIVEVADACHEDFNRILEPTQTSLSAREVYVVAAALNYNQDERDTLLEDFRHRFHVDLSYGDIKKKPPFDYKKALSVAKQEMARQNIRSRKPTDEELVARILADDITPEDDSVSIDELAEDAPLTNIPGAAEQPDLKSFIKLAIKNSIDQGRFRDEWMFEDLLKKTADHVGCARGRLLARGAAPLPYDEMNVMAAVLGLHGDDYIAFKNLCTAAINKSDAGFSSGRIESILIKAYDYVEGALENEGALAAIQKEYNYHSHDLLCKDLRGKALLDYACEKKLGIGDLIRTLQCAEKHTMGKICVMLGISTTNYHHLLKQDKILPLQTVDQMATALGAPDQTYEDMVRWRKYIYGIESNISQEDLNHCFDKDSPHFIDISATGHDRTDMIKKFMKILMERHGLAQREQLATAVASKRNTSSPIKAHDLDQALGRLCNGSENRRGLNKRHAYAIARLAFPEREDLVQKATTFLESDRIASIELPDPWVHGRSA